MVAGGTVCRDGMVDGATMRPIWGTAARPASNVDQTPRPRRREWLMREDESSSSGKEDHQNTV